MEEELKIIWQAPEYEEKYRTKDWYWALGTIIVCAVLASIIFENYFFALIILLAGVILFTFAIKKPEHINFQINSTGIIVRNQVYPFGSMQSFWIDPDRRHALFIKSNRLFLPIISIPIPTEHAENIYTILIEKEIPPEPMQEHLSEKILDAFGI